MSAAALAQLSAAALKFAADNPELVSDAVDLAKALFDGNSGAKEYVRLRKAADAERARRQAIAGVARRK